MKLYKNYFLALITALAIQFIFGINFSYAACEAEDDLFCKDQKFRPYDECYKASRQEFMELSKNKSVEELRKEYKWANDEIIEGEPNWRKNNLMTYHAVIARYAIRCKAKALLDSPDLFKNAGSSQQSNTSSNQSSSSGSSSQTNANSQSSPAEESNQPVAPANTVKPNKKSKSVTANCVKLNYNKTKTVNMCKFPINISYCLLHQDDQSIQVANSCYDGFVTETVYPGRALSDDSVDTRFFGVSCEYPNKPINLKFVNFDTQPLGGCP